MFLAFSFDWSQLSDSGLAARAIRIGLLILLGLPLLAVLGRLVGRTARKRVSEQAGMLAERGILYIGGLVLLLMTLNEFGFKLGALLGAAGIAGVAIGFASQTSLSNLISGIFLITEKPFRVGDLVKVGDTLGLVLAVDLLSIKLRKFDNTFVRIPNETLIKAELVNITRYPIRRLDMNLGVAYKEDIKRVMDILKELADRNPNVLDEPEPIVLFKGFGDSALEIFFGVWFAKDDFIICRNSILVDIKQRFDAEGIEIPFPHRTLYTGSATDPFPIRVVNDLPPKSDDTPADDTPPPKP